MGLPSLSLIAQSVLSGVFIGALYGLLGPGPLPSWGLLRQINLAHFALAFLAAYLCYQLSTVGGIDPLLTLAVIVPGFFALGVAMQWLFARFEISAFNSLLVTFGLTVIVESLIQSVWTADFRRLESVYGNSKFKLGFLYVPAPELVTLVLSPHWPSASGRRCATPTSARRCARGRGRPHCNGLRREPTGARAASLRRLRGARGGSRGVHRASHTLAPAQIYGSDRRRLRRSDDGWLGTPARPIVAGIVIGVSESVTMALTSPSWAPLVSFSLSSSSSWSGPRRSRAADMPSRMQSERPGEPCLHTMAIVGGALATVPLLGLPLFYESFCYLVFHWIVLATSWNILSGYSATFPSVTASLRRGHVHDGDSRPASTCRSCGCCRSGTGRDPAGVALGAVVFRVGVGASFRAGDARIRSSSARSSSTPASTAARAST
jgi:branched-chain amino acid transport system permease protein